MLLSNKKAIITGASRGIGREIAKYFAKEPLFGFNVICAYLWSVEIKWVVDVKLTCG